MKVLVVSDLRMYRDGAASALSDLPDVSQVATADAAAAAVAAARRTRSDVVLMDMSMRDSMAAVRALGTASSTTRVVALGVDEEGLDVVACAELGITGYVARNATLEEIRQALRATLRGEAWCSGKIAAELIRYIAWQARSRGGELTLQLTRREHDVLSLLEGGLANKEIARALDIQLSTVKNHVHNLLGKLGASSRGELVGAANGWVRSGRSGPARDTRPVQILVNQDRIHQAASAATREPVATLDPALGLRPAPDEPRVTHEGIADLSALAAPGS